MCLKFILMVKIFLSFVQKSTWETLYQTNIVDRNITENLYDLYKRSNWVISDFRVCDAALWRICTRQTLLYAYVWERALEHKLLELRPRCL